jgi:hypothetical protein
MGFAAVACLSAGPAPAQMMDKAPKGSWIYIASPRNGAVVKSPVKVVMKTVKIKLRPAGTQEPGAGHHHLIIDDIPPAFGIAVPSDETHFHYGKGQTEATLALPPGLHTITAQFADLLHRSYGPQLAHTIIIRVE